MTRTHGTFLVFKAIFPDHPRQDHAGLHGARHDHGGFGPLRGQQRRRSGRLVVRTYDKPLMAISYARLAQADFNALELAIERMTRDPASGDV